MKLTILRKTAVESTAPDRQTMTYDDLRHAIKSYRFFSQHLFRYQEVTLLEHRVNFISRPLLNAIVLRLLSRGRIYFEDTQDNRQQLTLRTIHALARQYLHDFFNQSKVLAAVEQEVAVLHDFYAQPAHRKILHLENPPLYLRTDLAFGMQSGGSIAHIAGVLNQLDEMTGSPIFISTDTIPTVKPKTHLVDFSPIYMDFPEIRAFLTTDMVYAAAEPFFKQQSISFIYHRHSLNNYAGAKLAKHYGCPLVLEYNGSEVWINKNWGSGWLRNETLSRTIEVLNFKAADVIVVVSQPLYDELVEMGIDADKILVNPNGVDPERYNPKIDGSPIREQYDLQDKTVIGFIGTFGAWHGAEVLAEAFGKLLMTYPDYQDSVRLLLIGDGKKMPEVKENLARYQVNDYCVLPGFVAQSEGSRYLAACDILVSPNVPNPDGTPFFSSPIKLFEYMAMGRGIVASALSQLDEVLSHMETAYLVEPGNSDALVAGLKALIDDTGLRQQLAGAARREVVARYTWIEHTHRIIDKLKARAPHDGA
jgi:glycosyltransferase involved in cell wall biosynthesis